MLCPQKLHILHGNNYAYLRGGSERYFLGWTNILRASGHSVTLLSTVDERNEHNDMPSLLVDPVDLQSPRWADARNFLHHRNAGRDLARLLEVERFNLAHLHIYYGQLTTAILDPLNKARIPVVQTLHDYRLGCAVNNFFANGEICEVCSGKHFRRALARRCNRGSLARTALSVAESYVSRLNGNVRSIDHFIAPSEFLRQKMLQHGIMEPDAITTVHNFIDPPAYAPAQGAGEYILYLGRLEAIKGIHTLIEAAAPLRHVPLVIVGDGEQRAELEAHVGRSGLDHIRFLGFRQGEDLAELVRGSICTVVPSECYEICPMSVLESFAFARPVVGADIGGIPELIDAGSDGFLFPSGDAEALRLHIQWMFENRDAAATMGQAARRRIEREFDAKSHYEQIMAVYRKVL